MLQNLYMSYYSHLKFGNVSCKSAHISIKNNKTTNMRTINLNYPN